jgi:hypothetical protein
MARHVDFAAPATKHTKIRDQLIQRMQGPQAAKTAMLDQGIDLIGPHASTRD